MSILPKMRRGDLDKMSFAFSPSQQDWDESGETPLRTIRKASLYDVSIVTSPAYEGTDIGLRSLEEHRAANAPEIEAQSSAVNASRMRMKLSLSETKTG